MRAPTLAWGEELLYRLPGSRQCIFGREFELLPAGTMLAAGALLHGVIGARAKPTRNGSHQIDEDAELLIVGTRTTSTRELEGYVDDIAEGYQLRQAQQAQG